MLQPSAERQAECIVRALENSGRSRCLPGCISAHATGTIDGNATEAEAIHRVFRAHAEQIPVAAIKSSIGHSLGASGGLAAVASILGLRDQQIPPLINHEGADPAIRLNLVLGAPKRLKKGLTLINAFAFGGSNAVLVVD